MDIFGQMTNGSFVRLFFGFYVFLRMTIPHVLDLALILESIRARFGFDFFLRMTILHVLDLVLIFSCL